MNKWFLLPAVMASLTLPAAISFGASGSSARIQIVDANGVPVRDAVVEIDAAGGRTSEFRFPWRAAMAQKDLQFTPGTLVVAKGSSVAFPNLDKVRHSVYSFSKAAKFEIDLYGRDQTRTQRFAIAGTVSLGCNIHDNMRGYVRVVDTPYAGKTDNNGIMTVSGVPDGNAKITVWHPRLRSSGNESSDAVRISGNLSKKYIVKLR